MEAKKRLARTITAGFHGEAAALRADENWARMFQQKADDVEGLEEIPVKAFYFWIDFDKKRGRVAKLITLAGLAESVADGERKLKAGAVKIGSEVVTQTHIEIPSGSKTMIRVGKRAKIVNVYFPAVGDRVIVDDRRGIFVVVSAIWGQMAIVSLLDIEGKPTITEPVSLGALFPAEALR
jgi:hypothetical protein